MRKTVYTCIITLLLYGGKLHAQHKALSLSAALEIAEKGNRTVQAQLLEEIHAKALTAESKGALLPTISANVSYSYYFDRQTIFLPGYFAGTSKPVQDVAVGGKNAFNGMLTLYQPIFAADLNRQKKTALINEQIERQKTADLKSKVALRVSVDYLNILIMNEQLALFEQNLLRNIRSLNDARSLFVQGRALKSDTLRSFIEVENIKSSVSYLKNSINVSLIELKRLIGMDESQRIVLSDKLEFSGQHEPYLLDELLKTAAQNRKDLAIKQLLIDLQQKKKEVNEAGLMPRLALVGQYQVQAQADNIRLGDYAWPRTSFLGLQLSIPIFNGNRTRSQINQANIKLKQEQIRLDDFRDEIKTQLATIISKWEEAIAQLEIQKKTVSSAELNYQMNEDRFKNGLGSRLELTDADLALTQARINRLRATYNLRMLHTEMQHALGLLDLHSKTDH
ncbi:TolC family protein [Sphingobacterium athyrii]|uniref:TolC family protein n=2 Tax=Bacteroidota TaxID=976 RepID=A0A363NTR8_9SPHI|nr:TolC family protein [Sphingobacterium athyrii]PUV24212.1 TolC family protein [Sphingobacterium athyrii]